MNKNVFVYVVVVLVVVLAASIRDLTVLKGGHTNTIVLSVEKYPAPEMDPPSFTRIVVDGKPIKYYGNGSAHERVKIKLVGIDITDQMISMLFKKSIQGDLYRIKRYGNWVVRYKA